jgi:glyoxylase-like metal-dependent hydrolase (beta-lactamase superfamily II)
VLIGGKPLREMRYDSYGLSASLLDSLVRLPVQLEEMLHSPIAPRPLAPGLYAISGLGGYTVMFQEFGDFVVALEAPAAHPFSDRFPVRPRGDAESLSRRYIDMIRSVVPAKPVRYVVPTHFHSDHAGGIGAFLRAGATLLAPAGDTAFYRALAKASGVPDSLVRMSVVEGKRVFSDGTATLELHSAAGGPHTKDGIVAWWPAHRIIYQGDLFYYTGGSALTAGRDASHRFFGDWLRLTGLCPARVYGTHSTTHGTLDELALSPVGLVAGTAGACSAY